jgi:hypothetical protein
MRRSMFVAASSPEVRSSCEYCREGWLGKKVNYPSSALRKVDKRAWAVGGNSWFGRRKNGRMRYDLRQADTIQYSAW